MRLVIDVMLSSLAQDQGERAIGVVLSGMGLVFPFGRGAGSSTHAALEPMPAPQAAMAPNPPVAMAPVETVPPPAAGVAIAPRDNERKRVAFNAESMFEFDTHEVQPQAKAALDVFVSELEGTSYDVIVVEGYTDRIGTDAYNQRLSQERADAVKAYLVASGKVSADKISAKGMSESAPVTQRQDCKGDMAKPDLIVCLQPDRRVEIGVVGKLQERYGIAKADAESQIAEWRRSATDKWFEHVDAPKPKR